MPARNTHAIALRRAISERGIATSAELQQHLGLSQPTVSRALSQLGQDVIAIGRGPSRRYALARAVPRVGGRVGVYSVSVDGALTGEGELYALAGGRYWFDPASGAGRVYDSLPWFAQDQRPEGFLGRALVRSHPTAGLPLRLSDWNDDQVLYALTTFGGSARGDLVFGDRMLAEAQRGTKAPVIMMSEREARYPDLAAAAIAGNVPGSSAGGEQPKFEAVRMQNDQLTPVIVKFSPPIETPAGARWKDLLLLEHLANQVLRERGIPTSASEVLITGGRAFLEGERFDRVGTRGRIRVFSLRQIDDEFIGARQGWALSAGALAEQGRLPEADRRQIALVDAFGLLIGNADMHFGNLSFFAEGPLVDPALRMAPVYDMSPMSLAPTLEGTNQVATLELPLAPGHLLPVWGEALDVAIDYWDRAALIDGLSDDLREIARTYADILRAAPITQLSLA